MAEKVFFVRESSQSLREGEGGGDGGREAVLRIVSPEDSNGFWCHVFFFAQHLTHGAVQPQSLRFNTHYDEICQSNRLAIGLYDCPK